jgi:DNA excision repair protein ERCC-2
MIIEYNECHSPPLVKFFRAVHLRLTVNPKFSFPFCMIPEDTPASVTAPLPVAIRQMVEFVLRTGDIRSDFTGPARALAGIRGHQAVRKHRPDGFRFEVSLSHTVERRRINLALNGRIDGMDEAGTLIEEIKTTDREPGTLSGTNELHWAQAEVYAWIWCQQNDLQHITIRLTYYHLDQARLTEFYREYEFADLDAKVLPILDSYADWCRFTMRWQSERDDSLANLPFPHSQFRPGQRTLSTAVFRAIRDHHRIFAHAPTGIGKTMGTLYPTLRAMGQGSVTKIFYLTAKTTGQTVAEAALEILRQKGLKAKALTLTAKEKVCFCPDAACVPEECPFADGFFDRLRSALERMDESDRLDRDWIETTAREHQVCPFEFSLEVALWADVIICDYNYAFDPRASLKRFFAETNEPYAFLVDEAHNLPERAREMFSAELGKRRFLDLRKAVRGTHPDFARKLVLPNKAFLAFRKEKGDVPETVDTTLPAGILDALRKWQPVAELVLTTVRGTPWRGDLLELYFDVIRFIRTSEGFDIDYTVLTEMTDNDVLVRIRCLDPARLLRECFDRAAGVILFSGTLLPEKYFVRVSGGVEQDLRLCIPSPFPPERRGVFVLSGIATRYRVRAETALEVAGAIRETITSRTGNYLVFFPSYPYLKSVVELIEPIPEVRFLVQTRDMDDEARSAFLSEFETDGSPTVGFAVLGGAFAEGIDLVGDRLIGAVVVGVGLPQVGTERDLIRDYFDRTGDGGFEFAYQYPGLNRVFQAAGRVIRSETDSGVIVLIDERFGQYRYRQHFPAEWTGITEIRDASRLPGLLKRFHQSIR